MSRQTCGVAAALAIALTSILTLRAAQSDGAALFDQAEALSIGRDLGKARDLYLQAAARDPDPIRRDRALIRAASLEWHVFHDAEKARGVLSRVADTSREAAAASIERAYLEVELARDFAAARAAARTAAANARTLVEREGAAIAFATAVATHAREQRLAGACPDDAAMLAAAVAGLRQAIDAAGPVLQSSRTLLGLSLMANDSATALRAWRWYFGDSSDKIPAAITDRQSTALALGAATLWPEADLVLRDGCAKDRVVSAPATGPVHDALAYAASLDRLDRLTREHYRSVARGVGDAFERAVRDEMRALWRALDWPSAPPAFSEPAFRAEVERRFGTVMSLGETDGIPTLLLGHKIVDERRTVEQYGHRAPLRFVQLDGMLSSGYTVWATRGRTGTAGWIGTDAIYQIRPMYADGPVTRWRRLTDADLRARRDEEIAAETRRDVDRAKESPVRYFRGLALRLDRQASEALRDEGVAAKREAEALRDWFLVQARRDEFDSSIWAHEGRHAIDKLIFKISDSAELEFRAKLSEAALARIPRGELGSLLSPVGPPSAHGRANERLLKALIAWMLAHAGEIAGFDPLAPTLPQLDKLTDAQIRSAFRSMDPLAK